MSRPESVSSSTQSDGSSSAICRISFRFFSPPEKPTLSGRRSISWVTCSRSETSLHLAHEVGRRQFVQPSLLALGVQRGLEERHRRDARNLDRILEGEEDARRRPLVRVERQQILAAEA